MATEIYGKATSYKLVAVKGANEENDDEEDWFVQTGKRIIEM